MLQIENLPVDTLRRITSWLIAHEIQRLAVTTRHFAIQLDGFESDNYNNTLANSDDRFVCIPTTTKNSNLNHVWNYWLLSTGVSLLSVVTLEDVFRAHGILYNENRNKNWVIDAVIQLERPEAKELSRVITMLHRVLVCGNNGERLSVRMVDVDSTNDTIESVRQPTHYGYYNHYLATVQSSAQYQASSSSSKKLRHQHYQANAIGGRYVPSIDQYGHWSFVDCKNIRENNLYCVPTTTVNTPTQYRQQGCSIIHWQDKMIVYGGCSQSAYGFDIEHSELYFVSMEGVTLTNGKLHEFPLVNQRAVDGITCSYSANQLDLCFVSATNQQLPTPRAYHTSALVQINGRDCMMVWGGRQMDESMTCLEMLDLETMCWFKPFAAGSEPCSRFGATLVSLDNNRFVLIGGYDDLGESMMDIHMLTVTPNESGIDSFTWSEMFIQSGVGFMPSHICNAVMVNECILLVDSEGEVTVLNVAQRKLSRPSVESVDEVSRLSSMELLRCVGGRYLFGKGKQSTYSIVDLTGSKPLDVEDMSLPNFSSSVSLATTVEIDDASSVSFSEVASNVDSIESSLIDLSCSSIDDGDFQDFDDFDDCGILKRCIDDLDNNHEEEALWRKMRQTMLYQGRSSSMVV